MSGAEGRTASIVVVGWGSLIWDPESLSPHLRSGWRLGGGPHLPIEFSRISPKRLGALAAVVDAAHGRPCATAIAETTTTDLDAARAALAARERAPEERIGAVRAGSTGGGAVAAQIAAWCAEAGAPGAVWTDLADNFEEVVGRPFSISAAEAHIAGLPPASFAEQVRYVARAPRETDTPLRRALAARDWWPAALAEHG